MAFFPIVSITLYRFVDQKMCGAVRINEVWRDAAFSTYNSIVFIHIMILTSYPIKCNLSHTKKYISGCILWLTLSEKKSLIENKTLQEIVQISLYIGHLHTITPVQPEKNKQTWWREFMYLISVVFHYISCHVKSTLKARFSTDAYSLWQFNDTFQQQSLWVKDVYRVAESSTDFFVNIRL